MKSYSEKKTEKNQNSKADYKQQTRKLWKWIVVGGNFLIISRIINWVTCQSLNINFKGGSRTPALSKVELIDILLSLISIAHSLKSFGKSLKSSCEEELF